MKILEFLWNNLAEKKIITIKTEIIWHPYSIEFKHSWTAIAFNDKLSNINLSEI